MSYPVEIKAGMNTITWPIYWLGTTSSMLCQQFYPGKINALSKMPSDGEVSPLTNLPFTETPVVDICALSSDNIAFRCGPGDVITIEAAEDFIMDLTPPRTFPVGGTYIIWPTYWPSAMHASEWAALLGTTNIAKIEHQVLLPTGWAWQSYLPNFSDPYSEYDFIITAGELMIVSCYNSVVYGEDVSPPSEPLPEEPDWMQYLWLVIPAAVVALVAIVLPKKKH